jgi:DNA-binding CsgD family transcriptional regulator
MVIDRQLRVIAWSDALAETTGVPTEHALGKPCWEMLRAIDEHGQVVCADDCALAHLGLRDMPVPTLHVTVPESGATALKMQTLTTRTAHGRLLVHVTRPRERATDSGDLAPLTPRQRETLQLLAAGSNTLEIASALGISITTARNHVSACLRKLHCHSRIEAVAVARRRGLVA